MAFTITVTGDVDREHDSATQAREQEIVEHFRRALQDLVGGTADVSTAEFVGETDTVDLLDATVASWGPTAEGFAGPEKFRAGPVGSSPPPQLNTGHRTPEV